MAISRPLTDIERAAIEARVRALAPLADGAMDVERSLQVIGITLMGMSGSGITEAQAHAKKAIFRPAIIDVPTWAVERALERWARGEVPDGMNPAFAPAPAEVRKLAMEMWSPPRWEVRQLRRLLDAEVARPVTKNEEARAALVAKLLRGSFHAGD